MWLNLQQSNELVALIPWLLCVGFAGFGSILLFISLWFDNPSLVVKMTGSSLVLSLAFAANQTGTYGIAMFIVATLVTDLEFLEKIAAIFWRSEPYFKYRMATASQQEVQAKLKLAIEADVEAEETKVEVAKSLSKTELPIAEDYQKRIRAALAEANSFESAVGDAIAAGKPPFSASGVLRRHKLIETKNFRGVVDYIYERPSAHYLIEIKSTLNITEKVMWNVGRVANVYRAYLHERNIEMPVYPILVIPAAARVPPNPDLGVYILRFDGQNFLNPSEVSVS
jgi:hypothetical protein